MDRHELKRHLDALLRLHDAFLADVAWCKCKSFDLRKAEESGDRYQKAYDAFLAEVGVDVENARALGKVAQIVGHDG